MKYIDNFDESIIGSNAKKDLTKKTKCTKSIRTTYFMKKKSSSRFSSQNSNVYKKSQ